MRRVLVCVLLCLCGLWTAGCHRGQVRLRVSADSDRYEWRDLIAPDQYCAACRALRYEIKPQDSYAKARRHPPDGHLLSTRIYWNRAVESLRAHFLELSRRHNTGQTTIRQFEQKEAGLLAAAQELKEKRSRLDAALADYLSEKMLLASQTPEPGRMGADELAQARARIEEFRAGAERIVDEARQRVDGLALPQLSPPATP